MDKIDLSGLNLSEKEQKILESAVTIFSNKGFNGTTTSEIAKNAGIAEGTIFRYFKTKKDILSGILVQLINLVSSKFALGSIEELAKIAEDKDMRWFLNQLIRDRILFVKSFFPMLRVILVEAVYHEEIREALYKNIAGPALKLFKQLYITMIEKGYVRNDLPEDIVFKSIVANIAGIVMQKILFSEYLTDEVLEQYIETTIDLILNGIAKKE